MMGRSHALLGAVGWLAAAPALSEASGFPLGTIELAAGTVVCAGAALLPDMDHPSATVANALGPITKAAAVAVSAASGGHRKGTHSILFAALATGTTFAAIAVPGYGRGAALVIGFFLVALGLRAAGPSSDRSGWLGLAVGAQSAVLTWLAATTVASFAWLPWCVGAGCLLHLLGDFVTPQGVPLFWPNQRRYSVPIVARTGNAVEAGIATLCLGALGWLGFSTFVPTGIGW